MKKTNSNAVGYRYWVYVTNSKLYVQTQMKFKVVYNNNFIGKDSHNEYFHDHNVNANK
jgi:hypothetical protein